MTTRAFDFDAAIRLLPVHYCFSLSPGMMPFHMRGVGGEDLRKLLRRGQQRLQARR